MMQEAQTDPAIIDGAVSGVRKGMSPERAYLDRIWEGAEEDPPELNVEFRGVELIRNEVSDTSPSTGEATLPPVITLPSVKPPDLPSSPPDFSLSAGVAITLVATDLDGNVIEKLSPGQTFVLHEYVQDLRSDAAGAGVFTAFNNLSFDKAAVTLSSDVQFSSGSWMRRNGTITDGGIETVGAGIGMLTPNGIGKLKVFSIEMVAGDSGSVTFSTSAASNPQYTCLQYGANAATPPDKIDYGSLTLNIE